MDMTRRAAAEFFGTFWLTFGGCGAAVLAGIFAGDTGITRDRASSAWRSPSGSPCSPWPTRSGTYPAATSIRRSPSDCGQAADSAPPMSCPTSSPRWSAPSLPQPRCTGSPPASQAGYQDGFASNGYGDLSPGKYRLGVLLRDGGADDVLLPADHHRLHIEGRGGRIRRHSDRARTDTDPPGVDPGDQHVGQSGAQHRTGAVRRRRVCRPALAVLAGAAHRRGHRRRASRAGCTSR